jgi:hypothetical protein
MTGGMNHCSARRRRCFAGVTRSAIPTAEIVGRVNDFDVWYNDIHTATRQVYGVHGSLLVTSKPRRDFGPAIVGEDWKLELRPTA